jgi:hypothetical protein
MKLMSNFKSEEENALFTALHEAAKDADQSVYIYLENAPKSSLVVELVDRLHALGYKIEKINNEDITNDK